jgi:hypothetical protein
MTSNKGKSLKSVRGWRKPKQGGQTGGSGYHQGRDGTHHDRPANK